MSTDQHPLWCTNGDQQCEHSPELWRHRTATERVVSGAGQMIQVWGQQYAAFYTTVAADPAVVLTLIGRPGISLTLPQAWMLGEHLAKVSGALRAFDLAAIEPGGEPHPTWCAWASTDEGNACQDSAFTRHHLTEMYEVLANDGTLVEVEGGIWTSDKAASDPLVSLNLGGQEVTITPAQAAELARALARTSTEIKHHANAA